MEEAIVKMLEQLDPHSTYSDPEEVKRMNEPLQGNFEGIGIQFNMAEDTLLVIQPVSGGPSEKVGILAGDRIVMVEDTLIAGVKMSTEDIMRRLRGPKDSKVNLKILRRGVKELLPFTVKRDKIPAYSLDASSMISAGYFFLADMQHTCYIGSDWMYKVDYAADGYGNPVVPGEERIGWYDDFYQYTMAECKLSDGDIVYLTYGVSNTIF